MKRRYSIMLIAVMVACLVPVWSLAGKGVGPGDGSGPVHDILAGNPFQYTGEVISVTPGQGMEIATAENNVYVFGIGPVWFWEAAGVDRPAIGETVEVSGYTVNFNGVERNILMSVTVGGEKMELRDLATGLPLWRGESRGVNAAGSCCGFAGDRPDCSYQYSLNRKAGNCPAQ